MATYGTRALACAGLLILGLACIYEIHTNTDMAVQHGIAMAEIKVLDIDLALVLVVVLLHKLYVSCVDEGAAYVPSICVLVCLVVCVCVLFICVSCVSVCIDVGMCLCTTHMFECVYVWF